MIQYKRKMTEDAHNQLWYYREDGFIYPQVDANLVLDIRGESSKPGTAVILYERKLKNNLNQLWDLIPADDSSSTHTNSLTTELDEEDDYSFSSASYAL
ncbi:unnamed protein product [Cunninghamella echinulata]